MIPFHYVTSLNKRGAYSFLSNKRSQGIPFSCDSKQFDTCPSRKGRVPLLTSRTESTLPADSTRKRARCPLNYCRSQRRALLPLSHLDIQRHSRMTQKELNAKRQEKKLAERRRRKQETEAFTLLQDLVLSISSTGKPAKAKKPSSVSKNNILKRALDTIQHLQRETEELQHDRHLQNESLLRQA